MKLQTVNEEASRIAAGLECKSQAAAEAYTRYRRMLKSGDRADRKAAAEALVECGSSAVFPLLRTIEDDEDFSVAKAALWSLLRLTDDMLGGKSEERDSPSGVLTRGRVTEPYLRVGLEAVTAQSTGGSPANAAYGWVFYLDNKSRDAGIRFLSDLVRNAPDLDAKLPSVLQHMSRRHVLPGVRRRGAELLAEYEAWQATGAMSEGARLAQLLADRRESVSAESDAGESVLDRLLAATVDPDRTVRHIAGAKLYKLAAKGAVIHTPGGMSLKDDEIRCLFLGQETLRAHPAPAESLKRVADSSARSRRCVLRLLIHLRPLVSGIIGADLDELIRKSMRDKDRDVRRDATAVGKVASSEAIGTELAGRLREQLRKSPPALLLLFVGSWSIAFPLSFVFREVWWMDVLPHFVSLAFVVYVGVKDRGGVHGISHDEYLETLNAMEPIANSSPGKLISSLPELRKLCGPGILDRDVKAKAQELLAKVHEATLHELPIAAEPPKRDAASLPVVAMRDDRG